TITKALEQIEKQSNMSIGYNASQLGENRSIDLNLKNASVEEALAKTLEGTGFTYKIDNNYIMIVAESKQAPVSKKITCTVIDDNNEHLICVNVSIKDKGTGTITDFDGNFTLEVSEGDTFIVSYIGYKAVNYKVTSKNNYSVQLLPDNQLLNEV